MRVRGVSRADDLAAFFEVSVRTIYRDIAHLQAAGLPIDGEAGVGYLLRPGFDLPIVTFTYEQVDALAVALSFAESVDDADLAAAAREVRAKIQANMPEPELRKLSGAPYFSLRRKTGAPDYAGLLREAIRKRRIVRLTYLDSEGRRTDRSVRPLAIWSFDYGWMFSGWCELRQSLRTFRLDRIACLNASTREFFVDEEGKDLRALLELEKCEQRTPSRFPLVQRHSGEKRRRVLDAAADGVLLLGGDLRRQRHLPVRAAIVPAHPLAALDDGALHRALAGRREPLSHAAVRQRHRQPGPAHPGGRLQFIYRTQDIALRLLSSASSSLVSFSVVLWQISATSPSLGRTWSPGLLVWGALIYTGVATALTHWIGQPLVPLNFDQQRYEADFRFSLARLREYGEQVALLGGEGPREQRSAGGSAT